MKKKLFSVSLNFRFKQNLKTLRSLNKLLIFFGWNWVPITIWHNMTGFQFFFLCKNSLHPITQPAQSVLSLIVKTAENNRSMYAVSSYKKILTGISKHVLNHYFR